MFKMYELEQKNNDLELEPGMIVETRDGEMFFMLTETRGIQEKAFKDITLYDVVAIFKPSEDFTFEDLCKRDFMQKKYQRIESWEELESWE